MNKKEKKTNAKKLIKEFDLLYWGEDLFSLAYVARSFFSVASFEQAPEKSILSMIDEAKEKLLEAIERDRKKILALIEK